MEASSIEQILSSSSDNSDASVGWYPPWEGRWPKRPET